MGLVNSNALPNLVNLKIKDESFLPRIVGFYEYQNALKMFDQLAAISTAEEMQVYDEVLKRRKEFDIYVGQPDAAQLGGERVVFKKAFKQSGLSWVTALARVELGAMISGYSELEEPFQVVAPTKHDAAEFGQLISEGWASHWMGLQDLAKKNNSLNQKLPPGPKSAAIVKLSRKSKMASDMLVVTAGRLNPATAEGQYAGMQKDYDQLQNYRNRLYKQLKSEMDKAKGSSRQSGWQTAHIPHCARPMIEQALQRGDYSVKTLK